MLNNMRTGSSEAGITPQELFTPIAQAPSPYTTWRATPWPKANKKLTKTSQRNRAYTDRMSSQQRCDCLVQDTRMAPRSSYQAGRRLTQQLFDCAHFTRIVRFVSAFRQGVALQVV